SGLVLLAVLAATPAGAEPDKKQADSSKDGKAEMHSTPSPSSTSSTTNPTTVVIVDPAWFCPRCVPELTTQKTTTWGYRAEPGWVCVRHVNLFRWLFPSKEDCPGCKKPIPVQALWKRKITTECPIWKCELYPKVVEDSK